jgi:hypothetical protein
MDPFQRALEGLGLVGDHAVGRIAAGGEPAVEPEPDRGRASLEVLQDLHVRRGRVGMGAGLAHVPAARGRGTADMGRAARQAGAGAQAGGRRMPSWVVRTSRRSKSAPLSTLSTSARQAARSTSGKSAAKLKPSSLST